MPALLTAWRPPDDNLNLHFQRAYYLGSVLNSALTLFWEVDERHLGRDFDDVLGVECRSA